jgi:uncharacterized protein with NAD-binding domain and iron-sulfur cluster
MAGLSSDPVAAAPRKKVAILGGGIGAVTTAFMLTDPSLAGRYEVTIYCMGWRLGGKGASGRNAAMHQRIEEHGLHIWFGAYRNAFALMQACYQELGLGDSFHDMFMPQDRLILTERVGTEWRRWPIDFLDLPGFSDVPTVYGLYELIRGFLGRNRKVHRAIKSYQHRTADHRDIETLETLARRDLEAHTMNRLVSPAIGLSPEEREAEAAALRLMARSVWKALERRGLDNDRDRRFWVILYLGITIARGILLDQLYLWGFDAVDGEELRSWLSRHSSFNPAGQARPDQLAFQSAALQAFYDASFSYADGDPSQPSVAASTGLRCILRILFDYPESIIYKMRAGMGDSVFAPYYQCLLKRGVSFAFFSRATRLGLDAARQAIETIEISRQVTVRNGSDYAPLVHVRGRPCWPNQPRFEQLVEGEQLAASGANLEHWNSGWSDAGGSLTLRAGKDFDHVVLAVSHAVLPAVARELCAASPPWQATVQMQSVATQAWQLWFRRRRDELRMDPPPEIFGGFTEPWSSIVDFSQVLGCEDWPATGGPYYLAYASGTLTNGAPDQDEDVKARAKAFLENNAQTLWPGAYRGGEFDWNSLYAISADRDARLDQHFFRANADPASRYVTAKPDTRRLRLRADQTHFANLTIAGEWTDSGVNISSIEATVISGMRASRAISGFPAIIAGEHDA